MLNRKNVVRGFMVGALVVVLAACQVAQSVSQLILPATVTSTATFTAVPPTATSTYTVTATVTETATPTATETPTPTSTNTPRPLPTWTRPSSNGGSDTSCNGGNAAMEASLLALINGERKKEGIAPLNANGALTSAARAHSKDMATNNFFSHTGSDGSSPFDRMLRAGYSYSAAAENIYAGNGSNNSAGSAFSAWMGSEGHRTNMLNSAYADAGVGYWCDTASKYGGYFTLDLGHH